MAEMKKKISKDWATMKNPSAPEGSTISAPLVALVVLLVLRLIWSVIFGDNP